MYEHTKEYDCHYQEREPYEVLYTKWLPYDDVLKLKDVEEMVEVYYNSGQFVHTLPMIERLYLNETKVLVGVDPSVIEIHGVYSPECAEAMARTVQENLHTAIAIGITGTTGNLDPNNADSVQGVVYFCILYKAQAHTFTFQTNVSGMTRHEIKQLYAEQVFAELEMILTSSL